MQGALFIASKHLQATVMAVTGLSFDLYFGLFPAYFRLTLWLLEPTVQVQQLRYFVTLIEKQSFTAAAHEYFITQSAISQQIKALEKELDVTLFERDGHNFSVTPAGKLLYRKIQPLLTELDQIAIQVQGINRNLGVNLRLGLLSSMDKEQLPNKLKELVYDYTGFELHLIYGSHEELYDLFSNGTLNAFISDSYRLCASESFAKNPLFATSLQAELPRQIEIPTRGKKRLKLELQELLERNYDFCLVCEEEHLTEEQNQLKQLLNIGNSTANFIATASLAEGRKLILQRPQTALIFDRSLMLHDQSSHNKLKCYTLQQNHKTIKRPLCCYARKNIGMTEIQELCTILLSLGSKKYANSLTKREMLPDENIGSMPDPLTTTAPNYTHGSLIY